MTDHRPRHPTGHRAGRRRPPSPAAAPTTCAPAAGRLAPRRPRRRVGLGGALAASGAVRLARPRRRRSLTFADAGYTGDTLVVLSFRGGFDGLSAVPPVGDAEYYAARPNIAVPQSRGAATRRRGSPCTRPWRRSCRSTPPASSPSCTPSASPTPPARTSPTWTRWSAPPPARRCAPAGSTGWSAPRPRPGPFAAHHPRVVDARRARSSGRRRPRPALGRLVLAERRLGRDRERPAGPPRCARLHVGAPDVARRARPARPSTPSRPPRRCAPPATPPPTAPPTPAAPSATRCATPPASSRPTSACAR